MTKKTTLKSNQITPEIRHLWPTDRAEMLEHFYGLEKSQRQLRFGCEVDNEFLLGYVETILAPETIVYGAFVDDILRGVAEIKPLPSTHTAIAEAALSVEFDWQNQGLGDALLQRLIATAQGRGIRQLCMLCLKENKKMQHLASKYQAIMQYEIDQQNGRIFGLRPDNSASNPAQEKPEASYVRAILMP